MLALGPGGLELGEHCRNPSFEGGADSHFRDKHQKYN